jgi:hypothetical protein
MKQTPMIAVVLLACLAGAAARAQTATDLNCTGCVGETDIAAQAVTSGKIANGTILNADLSASVVTSDKIRNGTIARADLATALRDDIDGAIADISFARISASGGGVADVQCTTGHVAVAASCECSDSGGARNLGVLFGCVVTGTGAAAGCYDEALSFNPQLPAPLAIVRAICMGAESVDGTPWSSTARGIAADAATPEAAAERDTELARWMQEQQSAFDEVLARFRSQRATFDARVR